MAGQVMRRAFLAFVLICLAGLAGTAALAAPAAQSPAVPVKGTVTLVDLGAKTCVPCRMMTPILEELEKEYQGRAAVVFIDVSERSAEATRFRIRAIPTQIFFDKSGREVARHEGFLDKKALSGQLDKMLKK